MQHNSSNETDYCQLTMDVIVLLARRAERQRAAAAAACGTRRRNGDRRALGRGAQSGCVASAMRLSLAASVLRQTIASCSTETSPLGGQSPALLPRRRRFQTR
uniref:Uncharacterized protein n=1 Tax=Plectus sambesii TaxID=2011161 RepID=A0A914WCZ7_9BILA